MGKDGNFFHEFIAGNIGGLIGITVVYPLDTAKTRLQVYSKYKTTWDVISSMVRHNGITSLYRGLTSPALGFGLTFAVSFSSYGYGCRTLANYYGKDTTALSFLDLTMAGAYTGFMQSPVRQVVERVKSVMQVRELTTGGKSPYSWSGRCLVELVKKEGICNGLFQGMSSVMLREIPQFAVYYPAYEYGKRFYAQHTPNYLIAQLLAGGTAGVVQWLPPIYCFDVIKSRMQTAPQGTYSSLRDCAFRLYREEGIGVYYRGLSPAILRAFPLHAIIFITYEYVTAFLQQRHR